MLFPNEKVDEEEFKRISTNYKDLSDKFRFINGTDYSKQFAHIYSSRLEQMRQLLMPIIKEKWGDAYAVKKMFELREDNPEKCVIIGTLFKHQQYKPSILREISEETQLAPQPPRYNFVDGADKLILEDELQRIRLCGNLDLHYVVTGIVCAILGVDSYEDGDGKFIIDDYLFYESGPQRHLKDLSDAPLLLFISGLDQSANNDCTMSLELLQQWIYGNLSVYGNAKDWEAANVSRIIVAGNSVRSSLEAKQKSNYARPAQSTNTLKAVKSVDDIIAGWIKSINVDLMPGEYDPSNLMLPQQPMHQCMFPKCVISKNFKAVTNPYQFEVVDRLVLGTSGQNIADIERFSKFENQPLEALRSVLKWGHIAPTSPDTLPCYPYYNEDPFIIEKCPHILFTGNSTKYLTDMQIGPNNQKTRLICIPSFSKTQCVVVVNLRTLDCQLLNFQVNYFDEDAE